MRESIKNLKIGVLAGGKSAEREISIKTGNAVADSLKRNGYSVVTFDLDDSFAQNLKKIDVCFIALHGTYGEDGRVQGALDVFGIPYTGSGVLASALAMDKIKSKALFNFYGLKTPPGITVAIGENEDCLKNKLKDIEPPYFIKPNTSGSSIGCGIANKEEELKDILNKAFKYDDEVLIEQHIKGREIQFATAFGKPLGCVEVKPSDLFYSYDAKYTKGKTEYLVNPLLTTKEYAECEYAAVMASEIIGCRGVSRTDIILAHDGSAYILELNTLPGLTELSLVPMIAANKGISFNELVEDIIEDAVLKKEKQ